MNCALSSSTWSFGVIREGSLETDATGTRRAWPVRTNLLTRGGDGHQLGRWASPVQGDTSLVGKSPQAARQLVSQIGKFCARVAAVRYSSSVTGRDGGKMSG